MKICVNCISDIIQSFSFAKRCETTDTILRNYKIKTELENTPSQSQKTESVIKVKEEMQIEIEPEIILPKIHQTVEVMQNYEYVEVKQEEEVKVEYVEDVKQEKELIVENEYEENYDENYEPDDDEKQDDTDSEKSDHSVSRSRHKSTNPQIGAECLNNEDGDPLAKRLDLLTHERIQNEKEKGNI